MNAGGVDKACKSIATPFSFCVRIKYMHYVYLIKSKKLNKIYTGYTEDLRERVKAHNSGKSNFTKTGIPWELVYYEAYASKEDAQHRERSLKLRSKAYAQLRKRVQKSIDES